MAELINHTECSCLFASDFYSDQCLKRNYSVYDLFNNRIINLRICNEHLRLLINNYIYENKDSLTRSAFGIRHMNKTAFENCFKEILKKYITINDHRFRGKITNDVFNSTFAITISRRPYVFNHLSFKEALEIMLSHTSSFLDYEVLDRLKEFMEKNNFKKYKTKYKDCFVLIRKIEKEYNLQDKQILMTELAQKMLYINSK